MRRYYPLLVVALAAPSVSAQDVRPTPEAALRRLQDGNARFVEGKPAQKDVSGWRRLELVAGQHPFAIVLSCSDSRVVPEYLFDQGLGELFVLRVAGNVTDAFITGSIDYAVAKLHTPLVVVLGHDDCGAVEAALEGGKLPSDKLKQLVERVAPGDKLPNGKEAALAAAVRNNARHQADQLLKQSPVLQEFVSDRRVRLVTGVYSLRTGKVEWLEPSAPKAKP